MALTRVGAELDFLAPGDAVQKTISKKYASEVEVVGGDGELLDVIYSGAETTTSSTTIGSEIGSLSAGSDTTSRVRVEYSNEDVARTTTEVINFDF